MPPILTEPPRDSLDSAYSLASSEETGFSQRRTLVETLTRLARRKWLIAKVTGAAVLAGAILAFVLPVRYTASTEIMPPRQTQSAADIFLGQIASANLGSLAGMAGGLGLKNPDDLYVDLLKSRPVADAIIAQFGLERVYRSRDMTAARQALADQSTIDAEKSGLIAVSVTDKDKQRAAAIANAYAGQLRALTQTLAISEASQRRLFYEDQLRRANDDLVAAELAFEQVERKKGVIQPEAQARALIGSLASLRAQVAAKQVEIQALLSYSTERNPDVQLAESQLASLRAEVSKLEQNSQMSGPSDLSIEEVPAAGLEYLRAEHELLYRQKLYDLLMRQYDAARLDEAKQAAIIQVVAPALPPDRKSSPKRGAILVLSALIGMLAGYALARLLDWIEEERADPARSEALHRLADALVRTHLPARPLSARSAAAHAINAMESR